MINSKICKIPVRLTKFFEFEASHHLVNYKGACERPHGHSYKLYVTVEGIPVDGLGMVMDFKELKAIVKEQILDKVDHYDLNDAMPQEFAMKYTDNTTCENMIIAFWYALDHIISENNSSVKLSEIKLYETSSSYATLTRDLVYGGE